MMKIGFDAKRALLNLTGLGNYSRNLIRALSDYHSDNTYFLYTPEAAQNQRTEFLFKRKNIKIRTPQSWLERRFGSIWRTCRLTRKIRRDEIDIFHGLSHELPRGIDKSDVKSLVTIHDLIFRRYPENYRAIDRRIYRAKVNYACRVADKIIAVSEQTKRDLTEFVGVEQERIEVIYQSCDPIFDQVLDDQAKQAVRVRHELPADYILNVGTIEPRKNLLHLINTLAQLRTEHDLYLVVIGNGKAYKEKVLQAVRWHQLEKRVKILSGVSYEDLPAIYQMAQMLIYPSKFEGFGIPIIEALFSRIPVITSTGSCFAEAGGPSTLYVSPADTDELTDAIRRILDDSNTRSRMIAEGYTHAQQFRDTVAATNTLTCYKQLLNNF